MTPDLESFLKNFPVHATEKDLIPESVWPDLTGVLDAKIKEYKNDKKDWDTFWAHAALQKVVAIDTETSGLRPAFGDRIVGVSAAYFDGKIIHAGCWNFRHEGHPKRVLFEKPDNKSRLIARLKELGETDLLKKIAEGKVSEKMWKTAGIHQLQDLDLTLLKKFNASYPSEIKPMKTMGQFMCSGYIEVAARMPLSLMKHILPVLEKVIIAGMNFKFDAKMFNAEGLPLPARVLDCMLIAHAYNENKRHYNLESLAEEMGERKVADTIAEYLAAYQLDVSARGHAQVPYSLERPYAIADAVITLKRLQWERNRWMQMKDPRIMDVFQIENAQVSPVAAMEIVGNKLDKEYVQRGVTILSNQVYALEKKIHELAGKKFDIGSEDQLWPILEAKGFKPVSMTVKGNIQLDDLALASYKDPLCDLIREYRKRYKVLGTYFKPFLKTHMDKDDILHPDIFIQGTVSGRPSCHEPNLMNIPNVGRFSNYAEAFETRRCFIPPSDEYSLLYLDMDQMEIKIFAEVSDEKQLLDALANGEDLHVVTAKNIFPDFPSAADASFSDKIKKIFKAMRESAKRINFGTIYGMGRALMALKLGIPVDETVRALELAELCHKDLPNLVKDFTQYSLTEIAAHKETHRMNTALKNKGWDGLRTLGDEVSGHINIDGLTKLLVTKEKNAWLSYSAETFLATYHGKFPKIKELVKAIRSTLTSRGYIFNRFGRRYHLNKEQSYIGTNRLVQGTSADMFKLAIARLHRLLQGHKTKIANQVYDEVQFYVHYTELDLIPDFIRCMTYFPTVGVKMSTSCKYSHVAWSEKREFTGVTEFLNSDTRKRSKAQLAELKKLYAWTPGKINQEVAEEAEL